MDEQFTTTFFEQIFDLWVTPEIERRNLALAREDVQKVLVLMSPGEQAAVLLNDEVLLIAEVEASGPIEKGHEVPLSVGTMKHIRPASLDPNTAWVAFVQLPDGAIGAFDLRRNRARAAKLLLAARDFLDVARRAADVGFVRPAIENAYAAAEYGVTAQMYIHDDDPIGTHKARRDWLAQWAANRNAPEEHRKALERLAQLRPWARYGEGKVHPPRPEEEVGLIDIVESMLTSASDFIGGAREQGEVAEVEDKDRR